MRCFGVLYLRNEGFAGRAEGSAPCGPVSCLSSTAWGACEKIRVVCYNPPAAICAKNISQAKNAVVARANCYIMRHYAAKACVLARKRGRLGLASRSSGEKEF